MGRELKSVWSYMMPVRVSFQSVIDVRMQELSDLLKRLSIFSTIQYIFSLFSASWYFPSFFNDILIAGRGYARHLPRRLSCEAVEAVLMWEYCLDISVADRLDFYAEMFLDLYRAHLLRQPRIPRRSSETRQ